MPGPGRGTLTEVCAVGPGAYWAVGTTALAERAANISLMAHYGHDTAPPDRLAPSGAKPEDQPDPEPDHDG